MKFLVDRCAGRHLAEWLRDQGHDFIESREWGPAPGNRTLLERATADERILVTIDTDFGDLVYVAEMPHAGMAQLLDRHQQALEMKAIITVRSGRIRISRPS